MRLSQEHDEEAGGCFFREGDPAKEIYFMERGRAKVYQVTSGGRQALIRLIDSGDVFGFPAILELATYSMSAEAMDDCKVRSWNVDTWMQLIVQYPLLGNNLALTALQAFETLRERFVYFSTQAVETRIAWALHLLGQQVGQITTQTIVIPEDSVQQDLADLAGTTIYTVSRILSTWERAGILSKSRGRIIVHQPTKLEQAAALA